MKTNMKLTTGILSLALVAGLMPAADISAAKKVRLSRTSLTLKKGKKKTLKVKNAKAKVKWSVTSGKKCIALKNKKKTAVTICGKKKGTAKVQAKVGKKKLYCKVTVKSVTSKNTPRPKTTQTPSVNPSVSTPVNTPKNPAGGSAGKPSDNPSDTPAAVPSGSPEEDEAALKALIAKQRARGATVSEDITDDRWYTWEDGRLTEINWGWKNLSGDISFAGLPALRKLVCHENQLTSLDTSRNPALTYLNCGWIEGLSFDVSKNTALTYLNCNCCILASLDISHNPALTELECACNQLTSLDCSKNPALTSLTVASNRLTSLNVSKNPALTYINCYMNQLTSLDLSACPALTSLKCWKNPLYYLDVSTNTELTTLDCTKNYKMNWLYVPSSKTEQFSCEDTVPVIDSLTQERPALPVIPSSSAPEGANAQDVAALTALINDMYKNATRYSWINEDLSCPEEYTWENGRLTGIDWFESWTKGSISFASLPKLTDIKIDYSYITSLDVSQNKALTSLEIIGSNNLTTLDLSQNTALTSLRCGSNKLTSLDLSRNTALTFLCCRSNQLTSLDLSKNTALTSVDCAYNQLTSLDLSACPALTNLDCEDNQLTSLDLPASAALTKVSCEKNQLTLVDARQCPKLRSSYNVSADLSTVVAYEEQDESLTGSPAEDIAALKKIIAEQNANGGHLREELRNDDDYFWGADGRLKEIRWYHDGLSGDLDLSAFSALTYVSCRDNERLTSIDVSGCTLLTEFYYDKDTVTVTGWNGGKQEEEEEW